MLRPVPSLNPSILMKFRIRSDATVKAPSMMKGILAACIYVSRTHRAAICRNLLDIILVILLACYCFIVIRRSASGV